MKAKQLLVPIILFFCACPAWAQGTLTFIYDQQSATESNISDNGVPNIMAGEPVGQSFTPSFSSVGFIRLSLYDSSLNNNQAAVLDVVLRSGSITGPILGTSDPVSLPAGFGGYPNFFFSTPVPVTPGTTYYWQPILLSGNEGLQGSAPLQYAGGTAFYQGNAVPSADLWFREGVVVPEPSTWALLLLGGGAWVWRKCRRHFLGETAGS